jgi:cytochrome b561
MLRNSDTRYGVVAKSLHWLLFLLILNQFVVAATMLRLPPDETIVGLTAGTLYNWHKSIGLIALAAAGLRLAWRKTTPLPDWAPNLSARERRAIVWIEHALYASMFLVPLSGFSFVMAGGFGVNFFSRWELPRFVEPNETVALVARYTHEAAAALLAVGLVAHWLLITRHSWVHRDGYLRRMLPFAHQD